MKIERLGETLFSAQQIQQRVSELGAEISAHYLDELGLDDPSSRPLVMVGILKGAFVFLADLARNVDGPMELDFIACSSYGSAKRTSGVVRIFKDINVDITGRHVLLIEDIVDTGLTLQYLVKNLKARGPASVEICALLDKQIEDKPPLDVKFVGFRVPDVFAVGYGLDCAQLYRNLPYIATLVEAENC